MGGFLPSSHIGMLSRHADRCGIARSNQHSNRKIFACAVVGGNPQQCRGGGGRFCMRMLSSTDACVCKSMLPGIDGDARLADAGARWNFKMEILADKGSIKGSIVRAIDLTSMGGVVAAATGAAVHARSC
ncbi:MAG: hypothetical protein WAZ48_16290 [Lysobacteraceae bacterium]